MKRHLKIQGHLLVAVLVPTLLTFIGIIVYVGLAVRSGTEANLRETAYASAQTAALRVENHLGEALNSARLTASLFENMNTKRPDARPLGKETLESAMRATTVALNGWVIYDHNAFDGRDAEFVNKDNYNETGRYQASYLARPDGTLEESFDSSEEELSDPVAGDYYYLPFTTGKEYTVEPTMYDYEDGSGKHFIATMAVPIKKGNKVLGVAGYDVFMGDIQKLCRELQAEGKNSIALYSAAGTVVYNADAAQITKTLNELDTPPDVLALFSDRSNHQVYRTAGYSDFLKDQSVQFYIPIRVGQSEQVWYLRYAVPLGVVKKTASALALKVVLASVLGLLFLSCVAIYVARSMSRPLNTTAGLLERYANLDFTYVESALLDRTRLRTDEIGDTLNRVFSLKKNIAQLLSVIDTQLAQFKESADSLNSLSAQSARSAEKSLEMAQQMSELLQGTTDRLNNAYSSVEEVSKGTDTVAEAAVKGAEIFNNTATLTDQAAADVDTVLGHIFSVGEKAKSSAESMKEVVGSVEAISSFISTIQGIADQTNLLALNAAIEAARAGESGRGFAVVAEEVRNLAEESNSAAKEVERQIVQLREDASKSGEIAKSMEEILGRAVDQAKGSQERMKGVQKEIADANDMIQNIAAASEETAAGSREMAESVRRIKESTEQLISSVRTLEETAQSVKQDGHDVDQEAGRLFEGTQNLINILSSFTYDRFTEEEVRQIVASMKGDAGKKGTLALPPGKPGKPGKK